MKSSLINSIGEVVTDYGARVMKVFKKGLLGRSLFDFYGDIKADALRTNESSAAPGTPADGKGGVIYTKSADGKLYYKSNEVSEVELSANGGTITTTDTPLEGEVLAYSDSTIVWGHPEKIHLQVRNDEGATIPAGAPLYSKGEIGGSNRILVGICDADDAAKMPCIGLAEAEMNTTSTKDNFAITQGVYNTNISGFTGLSVGNTLYVDTSGSAPHLTKTKPTGESSFIQNVGIVLKTNGSICQGLQVSAIGRANDVPNLDQNALFIGNESNQAVATDAPMVGVITAANAGAARTVLGVDAAGTDNSTNVTLAGTPDYITISGQEITRNAIDLTADVTGTLPVGNGGTGVVSLTADGVLTGNGTSGIVAESALTYTSADEELVIGNPDSGVSKVSRRHSSGTNGAGGNLILTAGAATGNAAGGSIEFHSSVAGSSGSTVQSTAEVATIDKDGNLSIDGDLTVKGNDIKDDDGTVCITFDSSGNTTVTNTLNASVTGNVTGNTSGSSGSCTGNAATATALTAGNKTIDGNLTIGAAGGSAGHDLTLYGDTNNQTLVWNASEDFLKFTDGAKIVFGTGAALTDFDSSIQANGSNLVIYNDTGNIQIGDTVEITGDLTVSGDLSIGNDAEITSVGSMVFRIDSNNNESSQTFTWKDNASDTIAALDEDGDFTVYGGSLGDPRIRLHQTGQNTTYGPPLLDFYREDTLLDNADIGMINFIAKDSADNDQVYAKIVGGSEESGSGTEGGKIKLQVATHDGELQTGITIEDGDAEDEIDVTIANGSSSLTTVAGNLNVTTNIELGHASDTTIARTAAGTVAIEGKEIQTYAKHYHFIHSGFLLNFEFSRYIPLNGSLNEQNTSTNTPEYTTFVWPYDGTVNKIWVRSEADAGNTEMKLYKGANGATVGTAMGAVTAACGANTSVEFDMTSVTNSFSQGEAMAVRIDPTNDTDAGYNVTIECIFDLTT